MTIPAEWMSVIFFVLGVLIGGVIVFYCIGVKVLAYFKRGEQNMRTKRPPDYYEGDR